MQLPDVAEGYYVLFLEDLRRRVRLGVLAHEKEPQLVSFHVAVVVRRVGPGDGIEDVADYNALRDCVLDLTAARHFGLQETLCEAVIEELGARPEVSGVIVETRKLSVYEDAAGVGCRMARVDPAALAR